MSEITSAIVADVVAACQAGAEEAAGALSRSLDGEFTLKVGEATTYSEGTPEGVGEAGLAILLKFGDVGIAAILPESGGLLPDWYTNPDPTGVSKLSTLAQELSMLLVPETLMADVFEAAHVSVLSEALDAAGIADDAALVPLQLGSGEATSQMSVIWPLANPDALLPALEAEEEEEEESPAEVEESVTVAATINPQDFSALPSYSRSLLKVNVPVRVVLAAKKERVYDVVELALGTIIKFDKACDELLQLYVGEQEVAEGEAIKIGDKFGFRVSTIQMPDEHFRKAESRERRA